MLPYKFDHADITSPERHPENLYGKEHQTAQQLKCTCSPAEALRVFIGALKLLDAVARKSKRKA